MPTIILDAWGRRYDEVVELRVALPDGTTIQRTVTASKINTPEKLAQWVLDQPAERGVEATDIRRQFAVAYHVGAEGERIVDSVTPAELPEDAQWAVLASSPLGSVTVAEAEAIIDG